DFQTGPGSSAALTGRLTTAPIDVADSNRLLHFGIALSERVPEDRIITISQQPQTPLLGFTDVGSSPFVPQIRIPASFQQLLNLQFAAASGSVWTQAEWNATWIDQRGGGPVFFHGLHADCGWFLTGEHRPYQKATGSWGPVRVGRPLCQLHP